MKKWKFCIAIPAIACVLGLGLTTPTHATIDEEIAAVTSVIDTLETTYETAIDDYNATATGLHLKLVKRTDHGPYYKKSSMNAYTQLDSGWTLQVQTTDNLVASVLDDKPIVDALTNLSFKKYGPAYYYPITQQYINTDTGVICAVRGDTTNCGHINWQTITDTWAEYLNSIGVAYYTATNVYPVIPGDYSNDNTSPTITNSEYKPYQYTIVGIANEDAGSMFYRSSATSDWVYFTSTQSVLECSKYTGEAEKGFAGHVCYNINADGSYTNSTVGAIPKEDTTKTASDESIVTVANTGSSDESGIGVPDTGAPTFNESGAKAIVITAVVVLLGTITCLSKYIRTRLKTQVRFTKK